LLPGDLSIDARQSKYGLELSATHGEHPPLDEMDTWVEDYLAAEIEQTRNITMTNRDITLSVEHNGSTIAESKRYRPMIIGLKTSEGCVITGLAIVVLDPEKEFKYPQQFTEMLCEILLKAGDVTTTLAAC